MLDQGLDINRGTNEMVKGFPDLFRDNTVAVLNEVAAKAPAMITHLIVKYHLDVNASDACGGLNELATKLIYYPGPGSPLNYAITYSNVPAAKTLLEHGASIGSAWRIAVNGKNKAALQLLLDAGTDPSDALGAAIIEDYLDGVQLCLEYGGDVAKGDLCDKQRMTDDPTYYKGMSKEVRELLDEWRCVSHLCVLLVVLTHLRSKQEKNTEPSLESGVAKMDLDHQ